MELRILVCAADDVIAAMPGSVDYVARLRRLRRDADSARSVLGDLDQGAAQ